MPYNAGLQTSTLIARGVLFSLLFANTPSRALSGPGMGQEQSPPVFHKPGKITSTQCTLSAGDVLTRITDTPDVSASVNASVVSASKEGDCAVGDTIAVKVADLQAMYNHFEQQTDKRIGRMPRPEEQVSAALNPAHRTFIAFKDLVVLVRIPRLPALDPARRTFVVDSDVMVVANGQKCRLTSGDVLTRLTDIPEDQTVTATVSASKAGDCPSGKTIFVKVDDLEEMYDHFQELITAGMAELAKRQGTGNLPEDVDTGGDVPPPSNATLSIDGKAVDSDEVTKAGEDFQLRGGSTLANNLSDGLHYLREKSANTQAALSFHEFVWKENLKLVKFSPYKNSYAVVIGIEDYGDKSRLDRLPGGIKQCNQVGEILEEQGFAVKLFCGKDANRENIEAYFFGDLARKLGKDDRVLIYFGGHGYTYQTQFGNLGYLVTYGATKDSIIQNSIPMSRIQSEYVQTIAAKHLLFVIDACFSGLAVREAVSSQEQLKRYQTYTEIQSLSASTSRAIMTAGSAKEPGLNTNGGGIFTRAFLDGIKGAADSNNDGVVTGQELLSYVRTRVIYEASTLGYEQIPQYSPLTLYGSGEFLFIPKAPTR